MQGRKHLAPFKLKARSAVSNGKTLIAGIDGRSRDARRFRDLYRHYMSLTGGMHDEMCRSLASLGLQRERLDAAAVRGEFVDPFHLIRIINAINRTLARLNWVSGEPEVERRRRDREDREAGLVS
jgi:hypothetical protein